MSPDSPQTTSLDVSDEESLQKRYDTMISELQSQNGWSPRKCKRYLDSIARKRLKKVLKRK